MLIRTVLAVSAIAVGIAAAVAQDDPIAARKAAMKAMGAQAAQGAKIMKGEEPYDAAKAKAIFTAIAAQADKLPTLFPDSSKTGGETAALPAIWEKMDDFKARAAKLSADTKAAANSTTDETSFKTAFPNIGKECGGCHELYRAKKT